MVYIFIFLYLNLFCRVCAPGQNTGLIGSGAQASASHVPQPTAGAGAQLQAQDFTGVNSTTELHRLSEKVIKRIEDAIKEKDSCVLIE